MAIITLLTDFGVQDEYVGVLKGVIYGICPDATIVDISHGIGAQDIHSAAYMLKASYAYFPDKTIHVTIVDPGVGTKRPIIAAQCDGHLFLSPDNGLLSPIMQNSASMSIHHVENENLFLRPVSRTFHGRDLFAPVAAHLAKGIPLTVLGPRVPWQQLQQFSGLGPQLISPDEIEGQVVTVDRFGNLITNIHTKDLAELSGEMFSISIGDNTIDGVVENYAQGESGGGIIAIIGSRNCIEIAINCGNAAHVLSLGKGEAVRVKAHRGA